VAESALLSFTVVSAQVALTQLFARGYYGRLNGSAYGSTQVQGQPLSLALRVISGVPNPARADFYEDASFLSAVSVPTVSSSGLPLSAVWASPPSGSRLVAGCVVDATGARACVALADPIRFVAPNRAIALTLAGPTSAGSTALIYTVNLTLGSNTTPQAIGLFDADTGERLQEKLAPFTFTSPNGPNEVAFTLTLGQSRRVIASAYATDGNEFVSNSISVVSSNVAPMIAINRPVTGSEFPANSSVPITVTGNDPDGTVARVELWRVGDNGNPDTMVAGANAASLSYTLLTPSSYSQAHRFYATVIDNNGAKIKSAITTITSRYDITDPRYFVWTNMNAALKAGNKAAALEFLTPTAQVNYSAAFDEILPFMTDIAASYVSALVQLSLTDSTADYVAARTIGGNRIVYGLKFVLSDDGTWKLESM
jgi:Bacterial Ig domain